MRVFFVAVTFSFLTSWTAAASLSERANAALMLPEASPGGSARALQTAIALSRAKQLDPAAVDKFCRDIVAGARPDELGDLVLTKSSILSKMPPEGDDIGKPATRARVMALVLDRAKALAASGDADSSRTAYTAYVILAAQEIDVPTPLQLCTVLLSEEFLGVMRSSGADIDALQVLGNQCAEQLGAYTESITELGPALDALIATDATPLPPSEVDSFLRKLSAEWSRKGFSAWSGRVFCKFAWNLNCLAKARGDAASAEKVRSWVAARLKEQGLSTHERRWLEEVLSLPGGAPKNSGVLILKDPNQVKPKGP